VAQKGPVIRNVVVGRVRREVFDPISEEIARVQFEA